MVLENKLNINNQAELAKTEEKISKKKAIDLFDAKKINAIEIGTFNGLAQIHKHLFEDIYSFAGKLREVNISKDNFRFVPTMYLKDSLKKISQMPQKNYEQIIQKYILIFYVKNVEFHPACLLKYQFHLFQII